MLRKYEACLLLDPDLDQKGLEEEIASNSEVFTSSGANIVHKELWGRRGLAYPVKKKKEGYYYLFFFESNPQDIEKIGDGLKHREKVLRTLIITKKEFPEFKNNGKPQ